MTIDSSSGRLAFFLGFAPSGAPPTPAEPVGVGASSGALRLRLCAAGGGVLTRPPTAIVAGVPPRLPPPGPPGPPPALVDTCGAGLEVRLPPAKGLPARLAPVPPAMGFGLGALGLVARLARKAFPRPGELARECGARGCCCCGMGGFALGLVGGRGVWVPEVVPGRGGVVVGVVVPLGAWTSVWLMTAGSLRVGGAMSSSSVSSSCCGFDQNCNSPNRDTVA